MEKPGVYNAPSRLMSVKAVRVDGSSAPKPATVLTKQRDIANQIGRKTSSSVVTPYRLLTGYIKDFRTHRNDLLESLTNGNYHPEWVADDYMIWCLRKYQSVYYDKPKSLGNRVPSAAEVEISLRQPYVQQLYSEVKYHHEIRNSCQKTK